MAYFNFQLAEEKYSLTPIDIITLQLINQNSSSDEDNSDLIASCMTDNLLEFLETDGYIEYTKTKKENEFQRIRLSKTGRDLLLKIQKRGKPTEQDEILTQWLIDTYKKRDNSVKSNVTETARRVQWFREETNIQGNFLASLLLLFINDTFIQDLNDSTSFQQQLNEFKKNNPRAVLSMKAENVLWSPPDRYSKYYTFENSPLWNYYQDNKEHVERYWKEKVNQ